MDQKQVKEILGKPSSMAFNVICKAISKVFNSSPPFSGLRFDFNTPETAGQGGEREWQSTVTKSVPGV